MLFSSITLLGLSTSTRVVRQPGYVELMRLGMSDTEGDITRDGAPKEAGAILIGRATYGEERWNLETRMKFHLKTLLGLVTVTCIVLVFALASSIIAICFGNDVWHFKTSTPLLVHSMKNSISTFFRCRPY